MNDVRWNLCVTMNSLQLSSPRDAFESYLKPFMNKYIPDLKGILIKVDHQTLKVKASHELDESDKGGTSCIIQFHPLYPSAKVKFVVNATILCPTLGQEVDADVRVVKFGRIVCRFGDSYSIFVTVPTHGEEKTDSIPVDPQTGESLKLFVGDKVRLEITQINISAAGDVLRLSGRVLSVISRSEFSQKKTQPRDKTTAEEAATDFTEQEDIEESQKEVTKKRKKHEKQSEELQQQQSQETGLEPPKKKKKGKSEASAHLEASKVGADSVTPKKKDKKKRNQASDDLAVKRDPDGSTNDAVKQEGEESFFQVAGVMNPTLKGDPAMATGMQSPDIFSSDDE